MNAPGDMTLGILAYDGVLASQVTGIADLMAGFFNVTIAAPRRGVINCANRQQILPNTSLDNLTACDIVIVPAPDPTDFKPPGVDHPVALWLAAHAHACGTVCGIAGGVFLLGVSGLLTKGPATTDWRLLEHARHAMPGVSWDASQSHQRGAANILTAGGGACWQDACLSLTGYSFGPDTAARLARQHMLLGASAGQLPFIDWSPDHTHGDTQVLAAQLWMDANIAEQTFLERALELSGLTERTFKRRFPAATGHTPNAYMQLARINAARLRLEATHDAVEEIAASVGYSDLSYFRKLFRARTGMTPGAYRTRFCIL